MKLKLFYLIFLSFAWSQFDITPPDLTNFEFTVTDTIDITDDDGELYFSVSGTDDLSGLDRACFEFTSPTYIDGVYTCVYFDDGELEDSETNYFYFEQYLEPGTWILNYAYIRDEADNYHYYYYDEFEEMGFQNELFVINNPCSLLGDLNFDEELNVLDILLLVDILLYGGFESYDECGDINSDGNLDVMDVVNLVGIILDNS